MAEYTRADFLQDPPLDRLAELRGSPGVKLVQASGILTIFLGVDQSSAELRTSDVKGRNPFADRRVREAVYLAIDIKKADQQLIERPCHTCGDGGSAGGQWLRSGTGPAPPL